MNQEQSRRLAIMEDAVAANCPDGRMCYRRWSGPVCKWCQKLLDFIQTLRVA